MVIANGNSRNMEEDEVETSASIFCEIQSSVAWREKDQAFQK